VSFGLNAGVLTATVKTDYQTSGAYLTTAALSNHSHGNPTLALTNLSGTTASNSAGLTLSLAAASPAAGVGIEAGTRTATTAGTLRFETGNGITFGLNGVGGSVMTASHNALTTAMASNRGSDFMGTNTALTANGVSMTANSSGLSLNFPAFLTTAAQSSASNVSGVIAGTNATGGTATLSGNVSFSNANGVSFYTSAGNAVVATVATNYQSQGAYLTTAMLSNAATISNMRMSAGTTSNLLSAVTYADGGGVSFGLNAGTITATVKTDYQTSGAYLTTAMQSNAATISNINFSAGTTSQNLSKLTFADSNGISFGLSGSVVTATVQTNYLTTAAQSNHSHGNPTLALTNLTGTTASASNGLTISLSAAAPAGVGIAAGTRTATTAGNLLFDNANGITFGLDAVGGSVMTASHNGLTTAMASNRGSDFMGTNTALTANGVSMTANSSGLSLNFPAFLTTAMLSNAATISNINFSAGTTSGLLSALTFSNSNGISFGLNAGTVTATVATNYQSQGAYLTTAAQSDHSHGNPTLALTNLSGTTASNSAGLTISLSASTIPMVDYYVNAVPFLNSQTMTVGQSTSHIVPFFVPQPLSFDFVRMIRSGSVQAASTTAATFANTDGACGYTKSHNFMLFSRGNGASSNSLKSYYSTQIVENWFGYISAGPVGSQWAFANRYSLPCSTGTTGFTHDYASTAASQAYNSASATMLTGLKEVDFNVGTTLSPGQWWLLYGASSTTSAAGLTLQSNMSRLIVTYNMLGMSQATIQVGPLGSATQQTKGLNFGNGSFSTAGGGTTNSLAFTNITTSASNNMMYFQLMRTQ